MQPYQPLPTPFDLLRKLWQTFVGLLLVIAIALVMSPAAQIVFAAGGLVIALFGHWIIGLILIIVAGLARSTRNVRLF